MEIKNPPIRKSEDIQIAASELMPNSFDDLIILKKRALYIAKQETTSVEVVNKNSYIRFQLSNNIYGIPYQYASEVIEKTQITRVPHVPNFVSGVVNWRGVLLTVLNLKLFFNLNNQITINDYASIIVIMANKLSLGILADEIIGNDFYDLLSLEAPFHSANTIKIDYILGLDKGNTAILNVENIITNIKLQLDSQK